MFTNIFIIHYLTNEVNIGGFEMKKIYKVEVDCANCAAKMEQAIKKITGVKKATLNFMMQKLILEFEDDHNIDTVMQSVNKACKKIESDFVIKM